MKNTPKLRFKEFSGDWETKTLGKLGEFRKTYSFSRNIEGEGSFKHIHYGDIHMNYNGIISTEKFIPSIDIPNDENYELIKTNDIIFADASEDRKDLGKVAVVRSVEGNILSGLHTLCFRPNEELNSEFFLNHSLGRKYLEFMYTRGNGAKVLGISKSNLSEYSFLAPSKEEQEKLAKLFSLIDDKIYLQREKVEAIKDYKKGMIQKIFSQELRFKDDDGNEYSGWIEKKLGEIANLTSSKRVFASDYVAEGIPFYRGKEITELKANKQPKDILYITVERYNEIKDKYGIPIKGDLLLTAVGTLGNSYVVNDDKPFYFKDGNLIWFKDIKEDVNFLNYILTSEKGKKKVLDSAIGSTQKALTIVELNKLKFQFPEVNEQKKISKFLNNIDIKVMKEEEKLDYLTEYKKGLLQQMFV